MHALSVNNVCKSFGKTDVLKNINVSIDAGEFLILVGPSGCGKSTLLSMIAGLEPTSSGSIHIGDRDVTGLSPKDRDIAMVFQSYALYPNMNVKQNISFGLEMQKKAKDEIETTIERVSKLLQIDHLLDRKPSQLSGGQRQRVAMGRALARDPKLFLFDEPLSNLDAKLRVEMRAEIKQLHKKVKPTIVYVTHDQIEAMTLGDRIAVMKDGIIQQFGSPDDVYNTPVNMFVAGFMGSPSMNFIDVTLSEDAKSFTLKTAIDEQSFPVLNADIDLSAYKGKEVVLGIRPEHFHNRRSRDEYVLSIPNELEEYTGADVMTSTLINDKSVICRRNPLENVVAKGGIELGLKLDSIVFFDKDTQERI